MVTLRIHYQVATYKKSVRMERCQARNACPGARLQPRIGDDFGLRRQSAGAGSSALAVGQRSGHELSICFPFREGQSQNGTMTGNRRSFVRHPERGVPRRSFSVHNETAESCLCSSKRTSPEGAETSSRLFGWGSNCIKTRGGTSRRCIWVYTSGVVNFVL